VVGVFELEQNPPLQPVPAQFEESGEHESVEPYFRSSPAGFQAMLPDRSRTIRASGAVEVVKSASSPLTAASTTPVVKKKESIPRDKTENSLVFMGPPISTSW